MNPEEEVQKLSKEIKASQKILIALGDEMRQHLILVMITQSCDCQGMRVNDIAEKTSLSRPAVSHHLQILKNAGIVKMRREGTKNYYSFPTTWTFCRYDRHKSRKEGQLCDHSRRWRIWQRFLGKTCSSRS